MTPSYTGPAGSRTGDREPCAPWSRDPQMYSSNARRREEDSWVEVTSRPSSSSLSTANEVPYRLPEDRPSRPRNIVLPEPRRATSAEGSSQDEYDESSSESDRVMSSSNEDVARPEDDDDRTALGARPPETIFTPQPNAFSHPPSSHNHSAPNSYFPHVASTPSSFRQERRPHLQRERTSGSYQPDHDAALRASLTTLLSCAAAVRPKPDDKAPERLAPRRPAVQPTALRLVQEMNRETPRPIKQVKRRSRESSKERIAKKLRPVKTAQPVEDTLSPTLASWIISAGVIVALSAISSYAGYVWGKEIGFREGQASMTGVNCSREVIRGTRSSANWTNAAVY